ncbi:MAG: PQQ-binding-like beta-propeller repeat protein [Planctomycetota bacterium]
MTDFEHELQDEELDFLLKDKGAEPEPQARNHHSGPVEPEAPREVLKPTLHGDLAQVNLPDIFQSLVMSQMEGTLQVNSRWKVIYVHHESGRIKILLPQEDWLKRMGYRLLTAGVVEGHVLKDALRRAHKAGEDLADHLADHHGVDRETLRELRRALDEDAIQELFTQRKGNFAFYSDAYPAKDLETRFARCPSFEASEVLAEVARRAGDWATILREIDDVHEVFRPSEAAWLEHQDVSEVDRALLSQLDGTRSLSDIAGGMTHSLFDVMKAAQTMSVRGLIEKVPTEDLFALAEADISAEQVKRAAFYLNVVSTFRRPLSLEQLEMLSDILLRVGRPKDAGKAMSECADLVVDEAEKLAYLYKAKRLDPRNPAILGKLLDGLADWLARGPEAHADEDDRDLQPEPQAAADAGDADPQAALDAEGAEAGDEAADPTPTRGRDARPNRFEQRRQDFADIGIELAELELQRDQPDRSLAVLDKLESFGVDEFKVTILRSKVLTHLHRGDEAVALLLKLAASFRKAGKSREHGHCLEQVLRIAPNHPRARSELRDLRSAVSKRTRRLIAAGVVGAILAVAGFMWYGRSQDRDETRGLLEQARGLVTGSEEQKEEAVKLARQALARAEGSSLAKEAQALIDQVEAERRRVREAKEKAEYEAFEVQLKAARATFARGRFDDGFRRFLELFTHDTHKKRGEQIHGVFRELEEGLARELLDEVARSGTEPLPDPNAMHNEAERNQALEALQARFPEARRVAFRRFLELARLTLEKHHPFFSEEEVTTNASVLPGYSEELLGDFTEIDKNKEEVDKLAEVTKLISGQRAPGVDISKPLRTLDEDDLLRLAEAIKHGSPSARLLVAQEALMLADPTKLALLRILEDLAGYQAILVQSPTNVDPEQIRRQLTERLAAHPLHYRGELEQAERRFQEQVVRSRQLEDEETARILELRKAVQVLQAPGIDDQDRAKRLRELGFAQDRFEGRDLKTRIYDFVQVIADILERNAGHPRSMIAELSGLSEARGWATLATEARREHDRELMERLLDPEVQRQVKVAEVNEILAAEQGRRRFEPVKDELDALIGIYERLGSLHDFLAKEDGDNEMRLDALKDGQLELEVMLAGKNGRLQAIEWARRVGKGGAAARYSELLDRVEGLEDHLRNDLQAFTHTVQLDRIFKDAQLSFGQLDFKKALTNYRHLAKNVSDQAMREEFAQKAALCEKILSFLEKIEACGRSGDHRGSLIAYRDLLLAFPDLPFYKVVRLPLEVSSIPEGARLIVGGNPVGRTPMTLPMLAESGTEVRVELEGFDPVSFPSRTATDSRFLAHLELLATWKTSIEGTVTSPALCLPDKDLVVVTDRDGKVHGLRLSDGKQLWQRRFPGLSGEFDRPLAFGDVVVLVSREGVVRGLAPRDGATEWEVKVDEDVLFPVACLGRELALTTKTGKVLAMEPRAEARRRQLFASDELRVAPGSDGRSRLFVATTDGKVRCISYDGSVSWEMELANCGWASPFVAQGRVLVPTTTNKLHAYGADDGTWMWEADAGDDLRLGLAVDKAHVYVATRNKELRIFGLTDGKLRTKQELRAQPTAAPVLWPGGLILVPLDKQGGHLFRTEGAQPFCRLAAGKASEVPMLSAGEDRILFIAADGEVSLYPTAPMQALLEGAQAGPGK